MYVIQQFNHIASEGLSILKQAGFSCVSAHDAPHAWLLRSAACHELPISEQLLAVGRAGVGTNNIPVDTMTQLGIPVFNTPGANANAVKELVIAALLMTARHLCAAWSYTQQLGGDNANRHRQVEANKKQFSGSELPGKVLGVIGLGNIGVKVANTARQLGMRVVAYDPALTLEHAWQLRSSVQRTETLADLLRQSDYVTCHVPLNDATEHLINTEAIQLMKPGATLINCARPGIVDEAACLAACDARQLRYYVSDFPVEGGQQRDNVIELPHVGATTEEAEVNCACMAAQQLHDYLRWGSVGYSVNFPRVVLPPMANYRLIIVNQNVPNVVARCSSIIGGSGLNIVNMVNHSRDALAYTVFDLDQAVSSEVIQACTAIDGVIRVRYLK